MGEERIKVRKEQPKTSEGKRGGGGRRYRESRSGGDAEGRDPELIVREGG